MLRKKVAALVAAAVMLVTMLVASAPAFAEQGGTPNGKACRGQTVSILNRAGVTPPEVSKQFGWKGGKFNSEVRDGSLEVELNAGGPLVGCDWAHLMRSQAEIREALIEEKPIHHGNQRPGPFD